jgi:hypothetical protein
VFYVFYVVENEFNDRNGKSGERLDLTAENTKVAKKSFLYDLCVLYGGKYKENLTA